MEDILRLVEKEGRDIERIASKLGKRREEVEEIIERAEREGVILGYKGIVDWEKLGRSEVIAIVEVKVEPKKDVGFDFIAERIARLPESIFVYLISGTNDIFLLIKGRSIEEISSFVSKRIAGMEGVKGTETHFVLKKYKEGGIFFEEKAEKRIPLSF